MIYDCTKATWDVDFRGWTGCASYHSLGFFSFLFLLFISVYTYNTPVVTKLISSASFLTLLSILILWRHSHFPFFSYLMFRSKVLGVFFFNFFRFRSTIPSPCDSDLIWYILVIWTASGSLDNNFYMDYHSYFVIHYFFSTVTRYSQIT